MTVSAHGTGSTVAAEGVGGTVAFLLGTSAGGTVGHVRMLAAGCAGREIPAIVFGPAALQPAVGTPGAGVVFSPVEIGDRPRPVQDTRAVLRLRRLLPRHGVAVLHAHGLRAGALAAIARTSPRSTRPALVVTVHNAPPGAGMTGAIYRVLELIVARNADAVLCVSADLATRMRRAGAREVRRALVPTATPAPDIRAGTVAGIRAELGVAGARRPPVVLAVGRLAPQKGFDVLLAAARRWQDLTPVPLLVIAGEGPLAAALAADAAPLRGAVRLIGHRDDVPALLAAADVVVVPSRWEGQPLIVQQALRAGRPLVASRVGGIPDLTGQDAAVLVPPGDPDRLAAAVRRVLTDQGLAGRLARAAGDRARRLPSEEAAVDAALLCYRQVSAQRRIGCRGERRGLRRHLLA